MKTIVLDDDPTGTQSATGVRVLLTSNADLLAASLRDADAVYVQTNSRALDEHAAVALADAIRRDGTEAGRRLGEQVRFVLRGDSTLRGHVFAETERFLSPDAVMLFVPAFPDGGRTTIDGLHRVRVDGVDIPAHESEYAEDPVFPFGTGFLVDYVAEKSTRVGVGVPLDVVRAGGMATVLREVGPRSVVVPDAVTDDDIRLIAAAVDAVATEREVVVRSASPLAAAIAGVQSTGLMPAPLLAEPAPTLLVCGSHTRGASAQLAAVTEIWHESSPVATAKALSNPHQAGHDAAEAALEQLASGLAVIATERARSDEHNTLQHGEKVMAALTTAVRDTLPSVSVVVAKGGITSAEVAATGLGASSATVLGQVLPGVSVWNLETSDGRDLLYVVVPGNVGDENTLVRVLDALRVPRP